jgi:flagellar hook protein FlgE
MSMMGTAVSGMLGDTNWLSSISQNVANANTTGYKNAETEFATVVDSVGSATGIGGGVTTSVRSLNTTQGTVVGTSTTTDLAVQGDGYFVVSDSAGALYLTRNGSFIPDSTGDLVNSAGYYLMGYDIQNGGSAATSNSLAGMVRVNTITAGEAATPTSAGTLAMNLPSASTAVSPTAAGLPSQNPDPTATPPVTPTFTSETSLVTYDNLGAAHTINIYLTNTGPNTATPPADTWEVTAYDASDAAADGGFPYSAGPLTTGSLTFSATNGTLQTGSPFNVAIPNGGTMSLDLSQTTQLASSFSVNSATANGNPPSSNTGVTISANGTLAFQYSNGQSNPGYLIPLATVASEDNLTSVSGDAFQANQNSGTVRVGTAGTAGLGSVASSSLEDSTVDLASELTTMIEAQSAYQANSKVFQTGADLLDILNNLKA